MRTPWGHGWNVLAVAIIFQAVVVGITFSCFSLWVTPWMQEFHVGRAVLMTANAGATLASGVLMLFAGSAMDRYSMRGLIVAGIGALSVGLVLIGLANQVWQIIALYATLVAIGFTLSATLASQVLAAKWFPDRVGLAVGLVLLGSNVGGIVMPPIVGWVIAHHGWRYADFVSAGLVAAAVAPLVWWVVRLPAEGEVAQAAAQPAADAGPPDWTFAAVIREPTFWVIGLAFLGASLASYAFSLNVGPYANDLGVGPVSASLLISVYAFTNVAGRLLMGSLADRIDPRIPYWLSAGLIWGTLLLTLGRPGYPMLVVISALVGLGAGGLLPVSSAIVGRLFGPRAFGMVMGMVVPFFSLAAAFGPVIAAQVRDRAGSYGLAFAPFLVILPLGAIVMAFLRRRALGPHSSAGA